ncbi:transcriptional regulatory protein AfsQ1 [Thermobispora bispora]|mgnify:FL=1|uniref:response regulator transcription factor n=1 Tax=Thermobispora bispora TaxID=2006 RepID=UPI0019822CB0|nr:response regulator transcription factor [Thermobispora bispora]MBO2473913.1 DNA-binding response regulator [Actinomycetales bacterium]MBX6166250.1 response regulator transcription factor [Thermobispora bispora]MDI9579683.1 response regulator transcription factor [Thermobispora sp.]QSI49371.1 response regulator transcription factor [Thermobispora bispora]
MAGILLVEDDPSVRTGLELALTRQGHSVTSYATGEEALDHVRTRRPEIVILDVMLPGIDGIEVCRRIRKIDSLPVILLTALGDDLDVVVGLEAGADDYVVKPVQPRVLDARIRAILRRVESVPADRLTFGDLVIDRGALKVTLKGKEVHLTPTELRLLLELVRHRDKVLNRRYLLRTVWDHGHVGDSRLVDTCVQRIRAKIEPVPSEPRYIHTVRGFGYRFSPP